MTTSWKCISSFSTWQVAAKWKFKDLTFWVIRNFSTKRRPTYTCPLSRASHPKTSSLSVSKNLKAKASLDNYRSKHLKILFMRSMIWRNYFAISSTDSSRRVANKLTSSRLMCGWPRNTEGSSLKIWCSHWSTSFSNKAGLWKPVTWHTTCSNDKGFKWVKEFQSDQKFVNLTYHLLLRACYNS